MVILSERLIDTKRFVVVSCDSSEAEERPTENICDGSVCVYSDNGEITRFNELTGTWKEGS